MSGNCITSTKRNEEYIIQTMFSLFTGPIEAVKLFIVIMSLWGILHGRTKSLRDLEVLFTFTLQRSGNNKYLRHKNKKEKKKIFLSQRETFKCKITIQDVVDPASCISQFK